MVKKSFQTIDLERDKEAIKNLIYDYIKETYLQSINNELSRCKTRCEKYPCKEARLLGSLAPTLPEEKRGKLYLLEELFIYQQIVNEADKKLNPYSRSNKKEILDALIIKLLLYYLVLALEEKPVEEKMQSVSDKNR